MEVVEVCTKATCCPPPSSQPKPAPYPTKVMIYINEQIQSRKKSQFHVIIFIYYCLHVIENR